MRVIKDNALLASLDPARVCTDDECTDQGCGEMVPVNDTIDLTGLRCTQHAVHELPHFAEEWHYSVLAAWPVTVDGETVIVMTESRHGVSIKP